MESEDTTTGILRRKVRPRIAIGDDNPGEIWRSKHVCAGSSGFTGGTFQRFRGMICTGTCTADIYWLNAMYGILLVPACRNRKALPFRAVKPTLCGLPQCPTCGPVESL